MHQELIKESNGVISNDWYTILELENKYCHAEEGTAQEWPRSNGATFSSIRHHLVNSFPQSKIKVNISLLQTALNLLHLPIHTS
jgi:hypothetical protein